jgi:diguanylate cyclase
MRRKMCAASLPCLGDLIADALAGDPASAGFHVFYQPIVQLQDSVTVAVEALARWSHPLIGEICPSSFVGVAESLGLTGVVDDFVLDRACADADALARVCGQAVDVHVNVSASRLGQRHMELALGRALDRHRMPPDRLVLEVTETAQITDLGAAVAAARRIRDRGVRIALDDFGAGFNWMGRLHDLPVDIVKLDAAATHVEIDPVRAEAMCKALLVLCDALDLTIIAEGIETCWQAQSLARLGCGLGQGFLYGSPEPLARLAAQSARSQELLTAIAV